MGRDRNRDARPDWATTEIGFDDRRAVGSSVQKERRARVPKTQEGARESALVGRITRRLRATPGCYFRNIHGDQYHAGIPDIVGCLRGNFFAIEVKREGQKPSKIQQQELIRINASNGWATSVDTYEKFERWFNVARLFTSLGSAARHGR